MKKGRELTASGATPWPKVRIGDVCEVKAGRDYKDVESPDGKYPIYGTGGVMGMSREWRCPAGSVIVGRKGTLDNPMLINEPFWNIDTCFGVVPSDKLLPAYLWRFCQNFDFYSLVPASGRPSTTSDAVKAIKLPLPPLAEQKKIVEKVEKALKRVDALKAQFERMEKSAADYFKAKLRELFGDLFGGRWPMEKLEDHVDVLAGYAFDSETFVDKGVKVCGGLIIMPDRIKWEECKYLATDRGYEDFLLANDDIVVALDRPWISTGFKIGKITHSDLPCLLIQRTARLRAKDIDPDFLMLLLRDKSFKAHCVTSGTTVPHISHKDIETFLIPIPPQSVQREVVKRLTEIKCTASRLEEAARRCIGICGKMRKAILAEAFQ